MPGARKNERRLCNSVDGTLRFLSLSPSQQPGDPRWKGESHAPRSHTISRLGWKRGRGIAGGGAALGVLDTSSAGAHRARQEVSPACVPISAVTYSFRSRHREGLRSSRNAPKTGAGEGRPGCPAELPPPDQHSCFHSPYRQLAALPSIMFAEKPLGISTSIEPNLPTESKFTTREPCPLRRELITPPPPPSSWKPSTGMVKNGRHSNCVLRKLRDWRIPPTLVK